MSTHTTTNHTELTNTNNETPAGERWVAHVIPAHGGAGTSTLAAHPQLRGLVSETSLPQALADVLSDRPQYVVVAHVTAHGTARATTTVHELELVGIAPDQIHLALIRDGRGPTPAAPRARLRLLSRLVADITLFPYVPRWRYENAGAAASSRTFNRAADTLADRLTTSRRNLVVPQSTELTLGETR